MKFSRLVFGGLVAAFFTSAAIAAPVQSGTPVTTPSTNTTQWNGNTISTGNGSTDTGTLRVTLPSDSSGVSAITSALNAAIPAGSNTIGNTIPVPNTTGGTSFTSLQVAANTTSVAVDASAGQLYGIEAFNNSSTIAYIKLYNASQGSTTCGSGTPLYRGMIPAATSGGAGYVSLQFYGIKFSTAITSCVTTGFADADATAPAATTYIVNYTYK